MPMHKKYGVFTVSRDGRVYFTGKKIDGLYILDGKSEKFSKSCAVISIPQGQAPSLM